MARAKPPQRKCTSRMIRLGEVATAELIVDRVYKRRKTEVQGRRTEKGETLS